MHAVSLAKLDEVFDPDAMLYVTIEEFGQKFELLFSVTRTDARAARVAASGSQAGSPPRHPRGVMAGL